MPEPATAPVLDGEPLLTVDELATAAGLTVRNTRYYAGLGLVPPPVRRGRMAYYHRMHLAHLELVRALQPDCLIDGRLGAAGDYVTTDDNTVPNLKQEGDWEVPMTTNHTWGFRRDDRDWKSPTEILFKLADVVSMKTETFRALVRRVCQDRQVAYIWWLYDVYLNNGVSSESSKKSDDDPPPAEERR